MKMMFRENNRATRNNDVVNIHVAMLVNASVDEC
jgi:hypothetical protein